MEEFLEIQKECAELFQKKNKDYGNAFATYGPVGVLVRIPKKQRNPPKAAYVKLLNYPKQLSKVQEPFER